MHTYTQYSILMFIIFFYKILIAIHRHSLYIRVHVIETKLK